ncbi:MAG: outer membrane protein assembly factor BamE [Pseudomonadota bacterium]|nr:outer membrane protein assembly factor BamE [Pseudomonadota bacterium]
MIRNSLITLVLGATILTGCSSPSVLQKVVYRPSIQQGNALEEEKIAQLQVGMTREQVRYLLGTPVVNTIFDDQRWEYVYYREDEDLAANCRLTLFFAGNRLDRVSSDSAELKSCSKTAVTG